jgi:hypothetical protein
MKEKLHKAKFISFASSSLLLADSASRIFRELWWTNQEFFPLGIAPWFSTLKFQLGMNWPVGGHSSETQSHPVDKVNAIRTVFNIIQFTPRSRIRSFSVRFSN